MPVAHTAIEQVFYNLPELWDNIISILSYSRIPHDDRANYFKRMDLIKDIEEFDANIKCTIKKRNRCKKELRQKMMLFRGFQVISTECMQLDNKIQYLQNLKQNRQKTLRDIWRFSPQSLCRARGQSFLQHKALYRVQWLQREDIFAQELNQWRARRVHDRMLQEEENNNHQTRLRQAQAVVEAITTAMQNL